jgi:DNA-binding transcriptional LysR family regulator
MDRFEAMRIFVRVAESGSFAAVARQQDLDRSAVTRQIAGLETRLRVKLLARSTRRVTLTSAGTAYLEKCRVILNLVETAEAGLTEDREMPRGPIRLSVPLSFGTRHLSPLLLQFAENHPDVSLDVSYSDMRSNLFEEGIDLAVRITSRLEPGDVARRIGVSRIFVVAAPAYLTRHGEPQHPGELAHHECLGYTSSRRPHAWEFLDAGRVQSYPARGRMQANNGEVLLQAAIAGFGIACAPEFLCTDALRTRHVRRVLTNFPMAELGIHVVLPGNRHIPHRVRVLTDYLAAQLGPKPPWETIPDAG